MSMRHSLLALLSDGPSYGLKLRQDFEALTGDIWPINGGQVYTTLQRLERDGLIESDDAETDGAQRRFRLTSAGREELALWLQTPPDLSAPPRDDLVMKVMVALGVHNIDAPKVLQLHRRHLVEVMREYGRLKDASPDDLRFGIVADAEILRLDSQVRWLDLIEGRLRQAPESLAGRESRTLPTAGMPRRRARIGGRR